MPNVAPGVNDQPGSRHDWNSDGTSCETCAKAGPAHASSPAIKTAGRAAPRRKVAIMTRLLDDHRVAGHELQRLATVLVVDRLLVVEVQRLHPPAVLAHDEDVLAL